MEVEVSIGGVQIFMTMEDAIDLLNELRDVYVGSAGSHLEACLRYAIGDQCAA